MLIAPPLSFRFLRLGFVAFAVGLLLFKYTNMVSFSCDGCGDVIKKPKVRIPRVPARTHLFFPQLTQHLQRCRSARSVSCIDCHTVFTDDNGYNTHTTCISEAEKYQGTAVVCSFYLHMHTHWIANQRTRTCVLSHIRVGALYRPKKGANNSNNNNNNKTNTPTKNITEQQSAPATPATPTADKKAETESNGSSSKKRKTVEETENDSNNNDSNINNNNDNAEDEDPNNLTVSQKFKLKKILRRAFKVLLLFL